MKKCKLLGTGRNGVQITWECEEAKSFTQYGNGINIIVNEYVDGKSKNFHSWDCRYIRDYDFFDVCITQFREDYGNNFQCVDLTEEE